jgi:hypothetical protein
MAMGERPSRRLSGAVNIQARLAAQAKAERPMQVEAQARDRERERLLFAGITAPPMEHSALPRSWTIG